MSRDSTRSWAQNAAKATAYNAMSLGEDRLPYSINTIRNTATALKDITDWVKRNNPFKSTNTSKDVHIRRIANTGRNTLRSAFEDIAEGNLNFDKLNRSLDGSFDNGMDDSFFNDLEDPDAGMDTASSGDFNETSYMKGVEISTRASMDATRESTDQITRATYKGLDAATNKMMAANFINSAKIATQLAETSSKLDAINNNMMSVVEFNNSTTKAFYEQAQQYMQNQEQNLNDIKAIMLERFPSNKKEERKGSGRYDFLSSSGFDLKKFFKNATENTMPGMMMSMMAAPFLPILNLFGIKAPAFLDPMGMGGMGANFNPLKSGMAAMFPNLAKLGTFDKLIQSQIEKFFYGVGEGKYGSTWEDFGKKLRIRNYSDEDYKKDAVQWTGKDSIALREFIPQYLGSIDTTTKQIYELMLHQYNTSSPSTKTTGRGTTSRAPRRSFTSQYNEDNRLTADYDTGKLQTKEKIVKKVNEDYQMLFLQGYSTAIDNAGKLIDGTDEAKEMLSRALTDYAKDTRKMDTKDLEAKLKAVLATHANTEKNPTNIDIGLLVADLMKAKAATAQEINTYNADAVSRNNMGSILGEDINKLLPDDFRIMSLDEAIEVIFANDPEELENRRKQREAAKKAAESGVLNHIRKGMANNKANAAFGKGMDWLNARVLGTENNYAKGYHMVKKPAEVVTVHRGERILTADQVITYEEALRNSVSMPRRSYDNMSENAKRALSKLRRRDPITDAEEGLNKELTNTEVADATTPEERRDAVLIEVADNIKTLVATALNQSELTNGQSKSELLKSSRDKINSGIKKYMFGEKDDRGYYNGDGILGKMPNTLIDFRKSIKHQLLGHEYEDYEGNKFTASDEETIFKKLLGIADKWKDNTYKYVFGGDYQQNSMYKKLPKFLQAHGVDSDATTPADAISDAVSGTVADIANAGERTADAIANVGETTSEALVGEEGTIESSLEKANDALRKVFNKKNLLKHGTGLAIGAIAGGILPGGMGFLPSLLLPHNILGGAILGTGISLLTSNETFMKTMFGEKVDNERVGGLISKDLQTSFKKSLPLIIGGATLGALKGILLPTAGIMAGGPLGVLTTAMLGSGPIGGALLGIGVGLLTRSKAFQDIMFGEEDVTGERDGGLLSKPSKKIKEFYDKHKKQLKGSVAGALGGALTGAYVSHGLMGGAFSIGGPIGFALMGSALAIASQTDKFKAYMFGEDLVDEDGNTTHIKGLIPRIFSKFAIDIGRPLKTWGTHAASSLANWTKHSLLPEVATAFNPMLVAFTNAGATITDIFKNLGEKLTESLMKPVSLLGRAISKIGSGYIKTMGSALNIAAKLSGGLITAPFKVLNGAMARVNKSTRGSEKEFSREHGGFLGTQLMKTVGGIKGLFGGENEYFNAREKFATEHGLLGNTLFMRHNNRRFFKKNQEDIDSRYSNSKATDKYVSKWAREDGYDENVTMNAETFEKRKRKLTKKGVNTSNWTQQDLTKFMYNTKDKQEASDAVKEQTERDATLRRESEQAAIDLYNEFRTFSDTANQFMNGTLHSQTPSAVTWKSIGQNDDMVDNDNTDGELVSRLGFNMNSGSRIDVDDSGLSENAQEAAVAAEIGAVNSAVTWKSIERDAKDEEARKARGEQSNLVAQALGRKDRELDGQTSLDDEEEETPKKKSILEKIGEGLSPIFSFFKKGLLTLGIVALTAMVGKDLPKLIEYGKNVAGFLIDTVKAVWPDLKEAIMSIGPAVTSLMEGIVPVLKAGFQAIGWVCSKIPGVVTSGQSFMKSMLSGFTTGNFNAAGLDAQEASAKQKGLSGSDVDIKYLTNKTGVADATNKLNDMDSIGLSDYKTAWLSYIGNKIIADGGVVNKDTIKKWIKDNTYEATTAAQKFYKAYYTEKFGSAAGFTVGSQFSSINGIANTALGIMPVDWTLASGDYTKASGYSNGEFGNNYSPISTTSEGNGPGVIGSDRSVGYGDHFTQNDPRWKNKFFSRTNSGRATTMGTGGCGPTALANVASQIRGRSITPTQVASLARSSGYTADGGSAASLFTNGARRLGLNSTSIGRGGVSAALRSGKKVIISGKGNNGLYTKAGHIVSARGIDRMGRAIVDDPLRSRARHIPISALTGGANHAWSVGYGSGETIDAAATTYGSPIEYSTTDGSGSMSRFFSYLQALPSKFTNRNWANTLMPGSSSETVGKIGCVLTALSTALSNVTGRDYDPQTIIDDMAKAGTTSTYFTSGGGYTNIDKLVSMFEEYYNPGGAKLNKVYQLKNKAMFNDDTMPLVSTDAFNGSLIPTPPTDALSLEAYNAVMRNKNSAKSMMNTIAGNSDSIIRGLADNMPVVMFGNGNGGENVFGPTNGTHAIVLNGLHNMTDPKNGLNYLATTKFDPGWQNENNKSYKLTDIFNSAMSKSIKWIAPFAKSKDNAYVTGNGVHGGGGHTRGDGNGVHGGGGHTRGGASTGGEEEAEDTSFLGKLGAFLGKFMSIVGNIFGSVVGGTAYESVFADGTTSSNTGSYSSSSNNTNAQLLEATGVSVTDPTSDNFITNLNTKQYLALKAAGVDEAYLQSFFSTCGGINSFASWDPLSMTAPDGSYSNDTVPNVKVATAAAPSSYFGLADPGLAFGGTIAKSKLSSSYQPARISSDAYAGFLSDSDPRYPIISNKDGYTYQGIRRPKTALRDLRAFPNTSVEQVKQMILGMSSSDSPWRNNPDEIAQSIIDASNYSGIDPRMILSQAGIESFWGKSSIYRDKNNPFGITAYDGDAYNTASSFENPRMGMIAGAKWVSDNFINNKSGSWYNTSVEPQSSLATMSWGDSKVYGGITNSSGKIIKGAYANGTAEILAKAEGYGDLTDSMRNSRYDVANTDIMTDEKYIAEYNKNNPLPVTMNTTNIETGMSKLISLLKRVVDNTSNMQLASSEGYGRSAGTVENAVRTRNAGITDASTKIPIKQEKINNNYVDPLRTKFEAIFASPR